MPTMPVNNPPAPVIEEIKLAWLGEEECEKLKAEFNIETRQHKNGANTAGDRVPTDKGMESHHILQDAAMKGLVSKYSGWAVMLDGSPGGEHDVANQSQIDRNCPGGGVQGAGPATFGELQNAGRDDLTKALKDRKGKDGKPMGEEKAKHLADCLVVEAGKQSEEKHKGEEDLTPNTPVSPVKGCFAPGTWIWLTGTEGMLVEDLEPGTWVSSLSGKREVVRTEECRGSLVEIELGAETVRLAPFHRLRLASGHMVCADALVEGHLVESLAGPLRVEGVHRSTRDGLVHTFGFATSDSCPIGRSGVLVEIPYLGPRAASITFLAPVHCQTFIGERREHEQASREIEGTDRVRKYAGGLIDARCDPQRERSHPAPYLCARDVG
jgi:hypothetical protein